MKTNNVIHMNIKKETLEEKIQKVEIEVQKTDVSPDGKLEQNALLEILGGNKKEANRLIDVIKKRNSRNISVVK